MEKKLKRDIIQSRILRIVPKVDQVIITLDTICDPNIMTLAQAVLHQLQLAYNEGKGDNSVMDFEPFAIFCG